MILYKGTNEKMQCAPDGKVFQFEIGESYETEEAVLCKSGFHGCENPIDVFYYYSPGNSRYFIVEAEGVNDGDGSDSC